MDPGDENETNFTFLDLKFKIKKAMKEVDEKEKDLSLMKKKLEDHMVYLDDI